MDIAYRKTDYTSRLTAARDRQLVALLGLDVPQRLGVLERLEDNNAIALDDMSRVGVGRVECGRAAVNNYWILSLASSTTANWSTRHSFLSTKIS